jgi:hypothetical protein
VRYSTVEFSSRRSPFTPDSGAKNKETGLYEAGQDIQFCLGEGCTKLRPMKAVCPGMIDEASKKEIGVKRRVNLFKVKNAPSLENPRNLSNSPLPVFEMMKNSIIENRLHTAVPVRKRLSIGYRE